MINSCKIGIGVSYLMAVEYPHPARLLSRLMPENESLLRRIGIKLLIDAGHLDDGSSNLPPTRFMQLFELLQRFFRNMQRISCLESVWKAGNFITHLVAKNLPICQL